MKSKISVAIMAVVVALASAMPASMSAAEKAIGVNLGITTRNTTAYTGVYFQYNIVPIVRVAPSINYYFRNHDVDAFAVNVDFELPVAIALQKRLRIYPIAGLNYTAFNQHFTTIDHKDASSRISRFGLNVGAGVEYVFPNMLKLAFESRATIVKDYTSGLFAISVGYVF